MDFSNVIRTWFYNQDITSWYKEFNLVRNKFFLERGIFKRLIPASTAIGKHSSIDTAIVAGALAIQGKVKDIHVCALPSPLQKPAMDYGSSFSRAVELTLPDHRRLYISGTASIEQDGNTIYPDDVSAQMKHSIDVIDAILKSRQMDWSDITRAVAFFKHATNVTILRDYCFTNKLPDFPVIVTMADICRDDLLFEMEIDAIK
jgi:enamine deaminase RidA (YjgF/YER057c/UK114 family)